MASQGGTSAPGWYLCSLRMYVLCVRDITHVVLIPISDILLHVPLLAQTHDPDHRLFVEIAVRFGLGYQGLPR